MDGSALAGSAIVNLLGAVFAWWTVPADHGAHILPHEVHESGFNADGPLLFIVGANRLPVENGWGRGSPDARPFDSGDTGCPLGETVDQGAEPDFPVFGAESPLAPLPFAGRNPSYCGLIGADGRILRLNRASTSGDRHVDQVVARNIRQLRFRPALRGGRPVAAWHRLILNRSNAMPEARTGLREAAPPASNWEGID